MTKFGNRLEALISRNGGNKYRLSKDIGIDRVTLYRFVSGERVPSRELIDKVCDALKMSQSEEKELRELYNIAKIGEDVYERRVLVKDLISGINAIRMEQRPAHNRKSVVVGGIDGAVKAVFGSYNVNMLTRDVLDDMAYNASEKRIWTNVPFGYTFMFDHLRQLYFEMNGTIEIQHAIAFARDAGSHMNPNINLQSLAGMLPLVFCEGAGYQAGYYYPDSMNCDSILMPYYLLTEERLLMISADYKTAMLVNDSGALRTARSAFDALRMTPLFSYITNPEDMLGTQLALWKRGKGSDTVCVEARPCLMGNFTEEMIETYARKEMANRDLVVQAMLESVNYAKSNQIHSFFTVSGLEDFVSAGYLSSAPPPYALPLSMADRLHFLTSFRSEIAADKSNSRVVNPSAISVTLNTIALIFINSAVFFSIMSDNGMRMCYTDEPSIYSAFSDFYLSLHNTEWVYTKQETLDILDQCIDRVGSYSADLKHKCK